MVNLYDHVACQGVLMAQRPLNVIHRGVGHTLPLKDIQPLFGGLLRRNLLDFCLELVPVRDSLRVDLEFGIVFPLRLAQAIAQDTKQSVIAATKEDVAIFRLEGFVRDNRCYSRQPKGGQTTSRNLVDSRCAVPHLPVSFSPLMRQLLAILARVAV